MPLLTHQLKPHTDLLAVHSRHRCSIDSSDTGTGKTYVALQMAHDLGLRPLIVCPKSVVSNWHRVSKVLGVEPLDVLNPEKIKTGKTAWLKKRAKSKFEWTVPDWDKSILFFDEAHMFGATDSQNAYVMAYAKSAGLRVHMMSATLAESPLRLRAPGYLLDMHSFHDFWGWAARHACYRNPWRGMEFSKGPKGQEALKRIHAYIYPEWGVRVSIADLPDFPETVIQPESYDLDNTEEIQEAYEDVEGLIEGESEQNALTALLRGRQAAERLKCPLVLEMAREQLDEGHSVVIFTNFHDTIERLRAGFNEAGIPVAEIHGRQSKTERETAIQQFQDNLVHVCLANIEAGGVGVDLHDLKGRPRVSFIMPPLRALHLKQALGRIRRSGALSPSVQKIVLAAGVPVEDTVRSILKAKLASLDLLNDGDLTGGILG